MDLVAVVLLVWPGLSGAEPSKSYRLEAVDLKQRIIWGVELREPAGQGLAFGGQDQDGETGQVRTRILVDGEWKEIGEQLRAGNPLQEEREKAWRIREEVKALLARKRHLYFEGRAVEGGEEQAKLAREIGTLAESLAGAAGDSDETGQARHAGMTLSSAQVALEQAELSSAEGLQKLWHAQTLLEQAAEALDAEPAARALDCGFRGGEEQKPRGTKGLTYDPVNKVYLLFGGDHLDYLTNDTWVFDPAIAKWFQRHPAGAPPPRANHRMESMGDGRVRLTGGYTYASNTDYLGGQYRDLDDGPWVYDIEKNVWMGGELSSPESRTYRSGPFHPQFYLQGERPEAEAFQAKLEALPVNRWVTTDPPFRPRLNRDWGTAVLDPERDLMLRWSGGHSAHGGTDVPHYHFATNRWELPFPVEFPLGQLYSNTSYPNGFNFNGRPWMTGHTYQNYHYDPLSKMMVKAGRPRHHYLYDPALGDWIGRGVKPAAMCYNSCFYTLTLASTPRGIYCWDQNGRVHRFDPRGAEGRGQWIEVEVHGVNLPGAVVDNSTIAYDAKRDRLLMVTKPYGKAPFDGQVWALDLASGKAAALSPAGMAEAHRFAYLDRCVYHPEGDLVVLASYLNGWEEDRTPTPAYDCANNRWVTLELDYETGKRGERITRAFPHGRSCGLMFDPKRNLLWGTDTDSQVYVLRLRLEEAGIVELLSHL